MIKFAKVNNVKGGIIIDDKNIFLTTKVVSIVTDTSTNSISNYLKHIDIPISTRCWLI